MCCTILIILPTVQSVTSVHALLCYLAIRADSLVLILQNTQHLIEGGGVVADRHLCGGLLAHAICV